ncbi:MAG: hypothetical protein OXU43_04920 [Gammaproteobacteria bacterium]|nr:hypothetical protein [Gammaproteobacteria bacterium]
MFRKLLSFIVFTAPLRVRGPRFLPYARRLPPVLAILGSVLAADVATAAIKCWTNREGVRECGNKVPPEYSQEGHDTLSRQGIVVDTKEKALSPEEVAKKQQLEALEEEKRRQREEQAQQDRILLDIYAEESDIIRARDDKISTLDATIQLSRGKIEKLKAQIADNEARIANFEERDAEPPVIFQNNIAEFRGRVAREELFISAKLKERKALAEEYNEYLSRFRQLTQKQ